MSEPAGLLIEAHISASRLASFFGRSVAYGNGRALVGHVLCQWADFCERPRWNYADEGSLVIDHDPASDTLFIAWILNELTTDAVDVMWPVLETLAREMEPAAVASGNISSLLGSVCYETMRIENNTLIRSEEEETPKGEMEHLWGRAMAFWGIGDGMDPEAAEAIDASFFLCDALQAEWPNYVRWRDEERQAQLAGATAAAPFQLDARVYSWDGQVVERHGSPPRDIPFPGADPMTFREAAGFYVDKNHVWQRRLAGDAPPADPVSFAVSFSDPGAIWEYVPVEGAVGADFTAFDPFPFFWTDQRRIYARVGGHEGELVALPDVDAAAFRKYGAWFGTDGKAIFYAATRLPLRADHLKTEGFFIWDDEKVFFKDVEVPLNGASFHILGKEGDEFRIADAHRALILGSWPTLTLADTEG
jgi:hypothetical protein